METQCFVIAAAQAGVHNEKRESFGDSIVIDPWGDIIARLDDPLATGIAVAELDYEQMRKVPHDFYLPGSDVHPRRGCMIICLHRTQAQISMGCALMVFASRQDSMTGLLWQPAAGVACQQICRASSADRKTVCHTCR